MKSYYQSNSILKGQFDNQQISVEFINSRSTILYVILLQGWGMVNPNHLQPLKGKFKEQINKQGGKKDQMNWLTCSDIPRPVPSFQPCFFNNCEKYSIWDREEEETIWEERQSNDKTLEISWYRSKKIERGEIEINLVTDVRGSDGARIRSQLLSHRLISSRGLMSVLASGYYTQSVIYLFGIEVGGPHL